uniref:Uncharacterized protein n=1 Tax=Anopheles maculatus TaxID=74869 RepID=A0A182SSL3_9DIPT
MITRFGTTSIILLPGCRSITGKIGKVITSTVVTVSLSREDSSVPCTTRSRVTVASGRLLKQLLQEALNSTTYTLAAEGHHLHSHFGTLNRLPSCREVINRSIPKPLDATKLHSNSAPECSARDPNIPFVMSVSCITDDKEPTL